LGCESIAIIVDLTLVFTSH